MGEEFNNDEIIDLEKIEEDSNNEILDSEPIAEPIRKDSPKNYNLPKIDREKKDNLEKNVSNKFNDSRINQTNISNNSNNNGTIQKLNQIRNINRNIPPLGGLNSSVTNNDEVTNNQNESSTKQNVEKKVESKALTAATGGAIHGKTAEEISGFIRNFQGSNGLFTKKFKIYALITAILISFLLFFMFIIFSAAGDSDLGKNTNGYISGQMTDEELYEQLKYYGYCNNKENCKQKGIYQMFDKLKDLSTEYGKACDTNVKNNKPCGIMLNTGLIIETVNYYRNSTNQFDFLDQGDKEEDKSLLDTIIGYFKRKKEMNILLDDIESLALAQAEYVQDSCGKKYYQISFNKYISYLKYGDTSSHPNYNKNELGLLDPKPYIKESCEGPRSDYISTSYNQGNVEAPTISGNGKGADIAQYAIQFVGNPYVYGGTSLTNGTDCSGFIMRVMEHFNITVPRNSDEQRNVGTDIGTDVSNALPGDIICYDGHVALYLGDNKIVHASNERTGIIISNNASYRPILSIRRVWQ